MNITSHTKDKAPVHLSFGNQVANTPEPTLFMENTNEIWKDIPGYEGIYRISSFGRVKSLQRKVNGRYGKVTRKERILKPSTYNYKLILLYDNYRYDCKYVHRLVASAFIKNPHNKREVNHKDGNKKNNIVSNLEWVSHKENSHHAIKNGLTIPLNGAKLTEKEVLIIRASFKNNYQQLAKKFNVTENTIYYIVTRRSWKQI